MWVTVQTEIELQRINVLGSLDAESLPFWNDLWWNRAGSLSPWFPCAGLRMNSEHAYISISVWSLLPYWFIEDSNFIQAHFFSYVAIVNTNSIIPRSGRHQEWVPCPVKGQSFHLAQLLYTFQCVGCLWLKIFRWRTFHLLDYSQEEQCKNLKMIPIWNGCDI